MQTPPEEELIRLFKFGTARKIRDFISCNPCMDMHYPNAQLTTPLTAAIDRSDPMLLSILVDKLPGDVDATLTRPCARTALMYAALLSNCPETLLVLLRKGADPNKRDVNGWNVLFHAVIGKRLQNVAALLDCYAVSIESRDHENRTPLMLSVYLSSWEVFEYLLSRGADVNALDEYGLSALHLAILRRRRDCVIELLKRGADYELPSPFSGSSARELALELMNDILPVRKIDEDSSEDDQ